jgi:acyl-CoA oxidase
MDRLSSLSSTIVKSVSTDPSLNADIEKQKMRYKNLQILEDHTRVISEWKAKSTIDGEEFAKLIYGPIYNIIAEANTFCRNDPDFKLARLSDGDKDQQRYLTNKLLFKFYKRFPVTLYKFVNEPWYFSSLFSVLTGFFPPVGTKTAVHFCLYAKSILMLGTDKHVKFVERALALKDLGCFGLTELAHGSNVQGIITIATYDVQQQCFILNTPHEKGMKFWIGGAAQSANMSVIAANLIVGGKDYGVHLFIVPIRDEVSHDIIPGVTIGDCGLKQGINGVDNGFIAFRNVRVPLENLLDRITQVSPSGVVTSSIERKDLRFAVQLSGLSEGRVKISLTCMIAGLKACAIVLRFATVRRQFGREKNIEMSLIEYPGYQQRVFPHVTNFLIGSFAAMESNEQWQTNSKFVFEEKNQEVKEMHAIISVLKPIYTWWLVQCLNDLRMAMGGLGYSKHAEIGSMIDDYHVMTTWEGENYVLIQQTAKFLLKRYFKITQGQENKYSSLDYIQLEPLDGQKLELKSPEQLKCPHFLHEIMKFRAAKALQVAMNYISTRVAEGADQFTCYNEALAAGLNEACIYYGELYIYRSALRGLASAKSEGTRQFILNLLRIFAYNKILESSTVLNSYLSAETTSLIQRAKVAAYDLVKYDLVKSMDDLMMDNHFVISPFGNKDGNIYGRFISKLLSEKDNFGKPAFWREIWEMKHAN